jgi:hypothetical protein
VNQDWISPKEAAAILGYESVKYFTRFVLKSIVHRDIVGPKGGHRYLVSRRAVESIIEAQIRRPA